MERLLGPVVIPQILDAGFNFDFIDPQAIAKTGIPYTVLVLPGVERLSLATYRQIETYARNGGIVIALRNLPSRAPALLAPDADTPHARDISQALLRSPSGKGLLVSEETQLAN